jgi:hypothetical protein
LIDRSDRPIECERFFDGKGTVANIFAGRH